LTAKIKTYELELQGPVSQNVTLSALVWLKQANMPIIMTANLLNIMLLAMLTISE